MAAQPARALLTFELAEGIERQILRKGLQVSTPQADEDDAVLFETMRDLTVVSARLDRCFSYFDETYSDNSPYINGERGEGFLAFAGAELTTALVTTHLPLAEVPAAITREAVARTTILFDAIVPPAGEMPVVLAAGSSGILLHEAIGHGMEADFNRKGTSIYADKIGKKVASNAPATPAQAAPRPQARVNMRCESMPISCAASRSAAVASTMR